MAWRLLLPFAFLLLSACGLYSREPLIDRPDIPSEAFAGKWQPHLVHAEQDAGALPAAVRVACFDAGYQGSAQDETGKRTGERIATRYCPADWDGKPIDAVTIVRNGDAFARAGDDSGGAIRFRAMGPGLYLAQEDTGEPGKRFFRYWLFRMRPPVAEIYFLNCEDFPSVETDDQGCAIASLRQVDGEMSAFAAKIGAGDTPPIMILKPVVP